jgi:PEP-CTERM putative exosortase interaction domain
MKKTLAVFVATVLTVGFAGAQTSTVTATDAGTAAYGDASGFLIDFDATPTLAVPWSPALVSGGLYSLDSISIRYGGAQANTSPKYLGVYSSFSSGVLSGFLGVSDNAIDFTAAASESWQQFNFSGINLTVDSTVGSGSGLLYFVYQTGTSAIGGLETTVSTMRFDGFPADPVTGDYLANILAFGTIQAARAPEYQASITAVPEPSAIALLGFAGGMLLFARRRSLR